MNSVSEPPLTSLKPEKPVTFADVAMRIAQDGPIYAVIALVGALAIGGKATSNELVITAMGGLLARSWPRAVQVAGKAGATMVAAGIAFGVMHACVPRPTSYGAELQVCNQRAQTLQESIACENEVRTRYGRPLRDAGGE